MQSPGLEPGVFLDSMLNVSFESEFPSIFF